MPENQETLLPPRRTTRTRKATAPTGAETSAQASALPATPADDVVTSESAAPRATRARRSAASAAPVAQDDTLSAQAPAAPTRRRAPRATSAATSAASDAAPETATPTVRPATRRSAPRATQIAQPELLASQSAAESAPVERQPDPRPDPLMSAGASEDTSTDAAEPRDGGETPTPPLRRRFDVRARGPYGRATTPAPTTPPAPSPATGAQPPLERSFGQPPLSPNTNGAQSGQPAASRGAQGGATRGAMPYSPGGRGAERGARAETGRQQRPPHYAPQPAQQGPAPQYPTGNYPAGQRPQGRDEQRGGQPYTVHSPNAPYAPADPYGQRNQRGQQEQGARSGQRGRGGQGYQGYPDAPAPAAPGRGYAQEPRDQRRQSGRHNDQGYPNQGGYPQDRQDRRGAPGGTRGQPGRGRGGRDQMQAPPPLYTNPGANAPLDQRYAPYAPSTQRNQPAAPQQHVRTVEVAGMVFPSGHGAATADILDERTLQTTGRISLDDMRRWGLRSGDVIRGQIEERGSRRSLVALDSVNDDGPDSARERPHFDQLTATFPDRRARLEQSARPISARIIDLFAPLGFGSRALIVAPPKTGKTTLIREAAESVLLGYPDAVVMAVLVGERPEEVTDLRSRLEPRGGHVYAASFDESTERHAWLTQVAVERAKRVAESGRDAFMVLDSLTRLARAENLSARSGGRTLSGGIDAQALDTGRRAFGAARNLEEGGSITILATCLVDTGSRQDDVVYEEFKGTGNMELHLSRELSQRRLFPAVDAVKSGTRREELLLTPEELRGATTLRRLLADKPTQAATQWLLDAMERTPSNATLLNAIEQQTSVRAR